MGKHNSTRVDEGRAEIFLAIKMQGTNRTGEGGRRACSVTPDLSYDWEEEEKRKGEDNEWDEKKQNKTK